MEILNLCIQRNSNVITKKDESIGNAFKKAPMKYTGTKMIGIATLPKSNAIPVFSEQEAKDTVKVK